MVDLSIVMLICQRVSIKSTIRSPYTVCIPTTYHKISISFQYIGQYHYMHIPYTIHRVQYTTYIATDANMYLYIYMHLCIYISRYIFIYRRSFPTQQWYIYAAICSTWFDQNDKKDRTVVELPFDVPNGALGHPGISPGHRFPYDIYRDWNLIYWYILLVNGNISTYQQYMSLYIVIMGLLAYTVDNGIYC